MKVNFGQDAAAAHRGVKLDVEWEPSRLVNGHTLLIGMSGAGKTHTLRRMISQMSRDMDRAGAEAHFHVFDVHGDIEIPGASEVMFSEVMPFGLNPLAVNPDPHFGGPRKCIQNFISTVSDCSRTPLGVKQEAVLRNILGDIFRSRGFTDDPGTWAATDGGHDAGASSNRVYLNVPYAEKDEARKCGAAFDPGRRLWWIGADRYEGVATRWTQAFPERTHPTVLDVVTHGKRLLLQSFMGSGGDAITKLEAFGRQAAAFNRRAVEAARDERTANDLELSAPFRRARDECLGAYAKFLDAVRTGNEVSELLRFDSTDVLKSVVDRLDGLYATGIFKSKSPPFDPHARVWVYKLNALSQPEKKMFVRFKLQELFAEALRGGQSAQIRLVPVLDEVHLYANDDPDNILSTLGRESRKFGVAILAANQNANLPEAFISSIGTKIVLGIDEMYWKAAETKMNVPRPLLEWIKPRQTMGVQMKAISSTRTVWRWVDVSGRPRQLAPATDGAERSLQAA